MYINDSNKERPKERPTINEERPIIIERETPSLQTKIMSVLHSEISPAFATLVIILALVISGILIVETVLDGFDFSDTRTGVRYENYEID